MCVCAVQGYLISSVPTPPPSIGAAMEVPMLICYPGQLGSSISLEGGLRVRVESLVVVVCS